MAEPANADVRADGATTQLTSGDASADLVASFYQALLQDEPPTSEQEQLLFSARSVLRSRLVLGPMMYEPMTDEPLRRTPEELERRSQLEQKVDRAGPVVLEYFRQHRDWFIPVGMTNVRSISISSFAQLVRGVDTIKAPQKTGFVLVVFPEDLAARPVRLRSIVFHIDDGRINADSIDLDGFGRRSTLEMAGKNLKWGN